MQSRQGMPGPLHGLDLAPLYRDCLLDSRERRETYDVIAGELCDYGLQWRGGAVDAKAYRCRTGRLAIYSMRYGDEVTITPDLYRDFLLVHVCLRNGIELDGDGETAHVPQGGVYFSAPQRRIRLRWQEGCEQVIIRVPYALAGIEAGTALRPGAPLAAGLAPIFSSQLNMLLSLARQPEGLPGLADWAAHAEEGFARFAALHLRADPAQAAAALRSWDPAAGEVSERDGSERHADRRDRLVAFIESRLARPIQLDDLTRAVGVGRSQLNDLTQQAFGCAPMALVRRLRLQAARRDLEIDPDQTLTQLSLRYGFEHQSRFSAYYRRLFGEAPRETRGRLHGAAPSTGIGRSG